MNAHRAPHRRPRLGSALHILVVAAALGSALWVGLESLTAPSTNVHTRRVKRLTPPNRFEIEVAFGRLGLDPQALAAAGFTAEQVGTFASGAAGSLRSSIADYRDADAAANTAALDRDRLQRLVQAGLSTEQDRTAYATALSAYASAVASRQTVLDNAYAAGAAALQSPPLVSVLDGFRANHLTWDVPIQYLGDTRSQGDWVALRDAVANDRISTTLNEEPDPGCHQLLLTANATTNAAAANANLPNLPDLQAAWNTALGQ